MPGGQQQGGLEIQRGQRCAVGAGHPGGGPGAQALRLAQTRLLVREARGQPDLSPPAHARLPAEAAQEVRPGGQRILLALPQVDASVAVTVHGVAQVGGGHELRMSHRTGPGAHELLHGQLLAFHELQGIDELAGEELGAALVAGQGRERIEGRDLAEVATVVRLQAPERDQVARRHAVAREQRFQESAVALQQRAALVHARRRDPGFEIGRESLHELRLAAVERDHPLPQFLELAVHAGERGFGDQGGGGIVGLHRGLGAFELGFQLGHPVGEPLGGFLGGLELGLQLVEDVAENRLLLELRLLEWAQAPPGSVGCTAELELLAAVDRQGRSLKPAQLQLWLSQQLGLQLSLSRVRRMELALLQC